MEYQLPPLPGTLAEVLQVLSREAPVPDDDRLVEIIQKDPALSIYVLRQANAVYYGVRHHVTQIHRAVALLGLKRVCNLVLAAALKQTFAYLEDTASQAVYAHVLQESVAAAAFARDLALRLEFPYTETAFSAGLLHQVGRLVLLYSEPDRYVPLWYGDGAPPAPAAPSLDQERARFDTDHLQIGAATLRGWDLPEEFAEIIEHLRAPEAVSEEPLRTLTLAVAAGRAAAEDLFAAGAHAVPAAATALAVLARLHQADEAALARFIEDKHAEVRRFARAVTDDA